MAAQPVNIRITALDGISRPLRIMRASVFRFGKEIEKINLNLAAFSRRTGLANLGKEFGNVGGKIKNIGTATGTAVRRLGILTGAAGLAGGFIVKLAKDAAESAEKLKNLSDRSGIGVEKLQVLGTVAEHVGLTHEEFSKGIDRATIRIGQLKKGTGPLASELKKLSPALARQLKTTSNAGQAFDILNKAMNMTTSATAKAQIAQAVFGKGAGKFVNFLGMTTDEFQKAQEEAKKFAKTEDDVKKFLVLDSAFDRLGSTITAFSQKALVPILGPLTEIINAFTKFLGDLIVPLQTELKSLVDGFLNGRDAATAVKEEFEKLMSSIRPLISITKFLFNTFGTGKVILLTVAAVVFGPVLAAVAALIPALFSLAIAFLGLTWPIQAVILGVIALTAVAALIIAKWEPIKAFFSDLWTGIKAMFTSGINFLIEKINSLTGLLPDFISTKLKIDTTEIDRLEKEKQAQMGEPGRKGPAAPLSSFPAKSATQNAAVLVDFSNLPKGTKVKSGKTDADLTLNMGFAGGIQ